ncbi:beta-lactamase-like protein [Aspergillus pseudotamarii]|uniref:Beta-lactamase-like protein n=1 Tax=Aspergillus pseudotamarii TaxID=132259 RepID=A0A5N6T505_ASPPS|nr:beta-lactamase-like protein [Aspergillus pseudotamarii]KAE8141396.1 beta-lactamase-like protein [Aspergillus pseudotamarii]
MRAPSLQSISELPATCMRLLKRGSLPSGPSAKKPSRWVTREDVAANSPDAYAVLSHPETIGHRAVSGPYIRFRNFVAKKVIEMPGTGVEVIEVASTASAALVGVMAVALMRHCFEMTLQFVKSDTRNGSEPIINKQSAADLLIKMKVRCEAGRTLTWKACSALGRLPEAAEAAHLAKIFCSENAAKSQYGVLLNDVVCLPIFDEGNKWNPASADVFPRTRYEPHHRLPAAIKAAGYDIKDVKAVIMGHLHLDHAGGLEHFLNTDVPIYVHEGEFKHACWGAGTKAEGGSYLPDYLPLDGSLNWQTFNDSQLDLCTGITLHLCPGHTPGLCIMQVNLPQDGTFIWTTDQFHVRENYENNHAQGWLLRDHKSWMDSTNFVRRLQRLYSATLIFGHDFEVGTALIRQKPFYQ